MSGFDMVDGEQRNTAVKTFWLGILFSFLFAGLIWWAGRFLADVPHLPDAGGRWYYWQLAEYNEAGSGHFNEALRIPIAEYALVFTLALLLGWGQWIGRKIQERRQEQVVV